VTTRSQFPFSPYHTNNNHYINAMDSPNYNLTICNNMDVDYMIMQSNKRKNINKSKHTYTGTMVETWSHSVLGRRKVGRKDAGYIRERQELGFRDHP
jgi:hypothetical protein